MDRLLILEPQNLTMRLELNTKSVGVVELRNVMHTMPVAFRVQSSDSKKYTIKPQSAIIPPLGVISFEIVVSPQTELPEGFPYCQDKFTVKSVVVPGGSHNEAVSSDWFTAKKKAVFSDEGLKIVFVGGQILRTLVANNFMEQIREVLDKDKTIIDIADEQGVTAMHMAISSGKPELVQLLLEYKCNLESQNKLGMTPLLQAAHGGAALIAELLLANGANTEARSNLGWTALHYATVRGHTDVMRLLLEHGTNIDAAIRDGRTALHLALSEGHQNGVKLLLDNGCNVNSRGADGSTALHIASARGQVAFVKLLLDIGANKDVRNFLGRTAYDEASDAGQTLLFDSLQLGDDLRDAARKGDLQAVKSCIDLGAGIDGQDQSGWTALHRASFKGRKAVVEFLLDKHADMSRKDNEGYGPLHVAAEAGQKDIVQELVKRGANVNEKTHRGLTALHLSTNMNYTGISRILTEAGASREPIFGGERRRMGNKSSAMTGSVFKASNLSCTVHS